MDVASVERSFAELLAAAGDVVVAESRGDLPGSARGSALALTRRYRSRRRAFDDGLLTLATGRFTGEDARVAANMREVLEWLDELHPTPGARPVSGDQARERSAVARARSTLYRRYGEAARSIRLGPETLDRLTVLARLAKEPDPATRRRLFEAMEPLWRAVDGDGGAASPYRRLLRPSAERWRRDGSPIEAGAAALGLPPGSLEDGLRAILVAWRSVFGHERLEPWDYWYAIGAASRGLDAKVPAEALLDLDHRYLAALGADPERLGIVYDVAPRPGRPSIPVAFTIAMSAWASGQPSTGAWTPRPPWVFATYAEGGIGNLQELLHESGHAIHMAAVRTRPGFLEWPMADTALLEGTADVVGWDVCEPAWQATVAGSVCGSA